MYVRAADRQVLQYLLHLGDVVHRAFHRSPDVREEDDRNIAVHPQRLAQVVVINLAVWPALHHDVARTQHACYLQRAVVRILREVEHTVRPVLLR